MTDCASRLLARARALALPLSTDGAAHLAAYVQALLVWNEKLNLTAARDLDKALDVLVMPSLSVWKAWASSRGPRQLVDIGSGNGFPGVAAAVLWPDAQVLLVERRGKKARAIQACLEAAEITNAEAVACDAREVKRERPAVPGHADLVMARAVGPLAETTKIAAAFLAPGGRLVQWKSQELDPQERAEGRKAAKAAALDVLEDQGQAAGGGLLILYERPRPRRW